MEAKMQSEFGKADPSTEQMFKIITEEIQGTRSDLESGYYNYETNASKFPIKQQPAHKQQRNLHKVLQTRHLQMIGLGGSIGAGIFIDSGACLKLGGPGSLLLSWLLTGLILFFTIQALCELVVTFPVSGSFMKYNTRFISPSWGFAMAWNYTLSWLIIIPLQMIGLSITVEWWNPGFNRAISVTIFLAVLCVIAVFGVRGYGESEFILCFLKVIALAGFIILAIVLNSGGGPDHEKGYIGGLYWHEPGAFNNGFKGFCTILPSAVFAFSGVEVIGLAAAETQCTKVTIPAASKQVIWRILVLYIGSMTMVGLLVPYNDPHLLSASIYVPNESAFSIAVRNGGLPAMTSVVNAAILIALFSVANTGVYASSRCLASIAEQGFGPKFIGYVDKSGRPLVGVLASILFGALGYLSVTKEFSEFFKWLNSLVGLSTIFSWMSINLCHIRFRHAMKKHGRCVEEELDYVSLTGLTGSYCNVVLLGFVFVVQFWDSLWPIGMKSSARHFFEVWLCAPVVLLFWIGYMIWKRDFRILVDLEGIDLDSDRLNQDLKLQKREVAAQREYFASRSFFYRFYKFWC
ncbi:unnamed protein product [Ambrosiozyma monospora]|uniref:Unnamed protein product n=1 Tax=Ambrosiozyma monospora TaxID=43982 RepID=A0ACB5SVK0_AMBMO|nr:unnamed protein product [Ambrosiozyma monospora]